MRLSTGWMPFGRHNEPGGGPRSRVVWMIVGVAVGMIGWGGFNTAMEATNRLDFCISCHEMRSTVDEEYRTSVHWSNPSGVRAICSDCHVPKDWTHKLIRKVQASRELWGKLVGTIDTAEKFEARRLDLARHEWARMRESGSRECRNCHAFEAMDFHGQRPKAAEAMRTAQEKGFTCIDCHKGIAHRLPDLTARHRDMHRRLVATSPASAVIGDRLTTIDAVPLFAEAQPVEGGGEVARLAPATAVTVLRHSGERFEIEARVWRREGPSRTLYAAFGRRIAAATVGDPARLAFEPTGSRIEPEREETWVEGRLRGWVGLAGFTTDADGLASYGEELYEANCSFCHALPQTRAYDTEKWISNLNAMRRMVPLEEDEIAFLLKYLQARAKDAGGGLDTRR